MENRCTHIATTALVAITFTSVHVHAQLSYPLDSTVLAIDVVLDSSRVDIPWEILWGPDDRLWMTDGPMITRWDPVTDVVDTLLDRGYGNGLGMALHPDFPSTPIVMAVFDTGAYYGNTASICEVSRFTYDAINDTLVNETVLFNYYHAGEHAGGRMIFDTSGYVLLTTADYWLNGPDTLFSTNGKTLRFATDGSVPPDNPRADHTWTWGHRNPQGLARLPNGAVVNTEHGQMPFSNEINLLQRNEDHGYPYYDGTTCFLIPDTCNSTTYTYTHPIRTFSHPPAGCEFYTSNAIPEFQNKLITGILWHRGIMLFDFNAALDSVVGEEYLEGGAFDLMWRNRDIAIRPDGSFYLITNDRMDARIRWVHPDLSTPLPEISSLDHAARIWPNPTNDRLTVVAEGDATIALLDRQGRSLPVTMHRMGDRFLLDLATLPAGLYVIRVREDGTSRTARVVKR
ncbi:MAG: PQQ-dependent sugar dehydrogenase [Flavobacteriales bacterium]|jgi:glucose/arabinose dehydrogenase|nr:PQQ-dependent sugar dehydrogenase [Flavobacteriales bacterium]MBK9075293.1 PQQ-dependent sugar dehydrogenase [Flavobacteriales bacterium]